MNTWSERLVPALLLVAGLLSAAAAAAGLAGPPPLDAALGSWWPYHHLLLSAVALAVGCAAFWPAARLPVLPAAVLVKVASLPLTLAGAPWLPALEGLALLALLAGGALHARAAWRQARWEAGPAMHLWPEG